MPVCIELQHSTPIEHLGILHRGPQRRDVISRIAYKQDFRLNITSKRAIETPFRTNTPVYTPETHRSHRCTRAARGVNARLKVRCECRWAACERRLIGAEDRERGIC